MQKISGVSCDVQYRIIWLALFSQTSLAHLQCSLSSLGTSYEGWRATSHCPYMDNCLMEQVFIGKPEEHTLFIGLWQLVEFWLRDTCSPHTTHRQWLIGKCTHPIMHWPLVGSLYNLLLSHGEWLGSNLVSQQVRLSVWPHITLLSQLTHPPGNALGYYRIWHICM